MNKSLKYFLTSSLLIGIFFFSYIIKAQNITNNAITKADDLRAIPYAIVMIEADWCSTCNQQKKALSELLKQNKYKTFKLYTINFDKQKELLKVFNVTMQSTLIFYKNGIENNRITGETRINELSKILDKAL